MLRWEYSTAVTSLHVELCRLPSESTANVENVLLMTWLVSLKIVSNEFGRFQRERPPTVSTFELDGRYRLKMCRDRTLCFSDYSPIFALREKHNRDF
jgi:hypothetical protein